VKHVEFTDDMNDNDEENARDHQQQQKLHRRDTPHHLKNKRIVTKNTDALTFDVRVLSPTKKNGLEIVYSFISANYVTQLDEIIVNQSRKRGM
jgi:hypothetical protein